MMPFRRSRQRSQSAQSIVEAAVTLALISIVAVALLQGIARKSMTRLAQARDALDGGKTVTSLKASALSSVSTNADTTSR